MSCSVRVLAVALFCVGRSRESKKCVGAWSTRWGPLFPTLFGSEHRFSLVATPVPWKPSAPGGGALDIVDALKRNPDQHDGRGHRLHGSMNAKGRREPDNGYGLRMDS